MQRLSVLFFVLFSALYSVTAVFGQETQWGKILDGFKDPQRGYYDTALDYLEWMRTSPLCPSDLRPQIDYQIASVHLDAVENNAMFLTRDEHLKRCREALEKYLKEHPDGDAAFEAESSLGRLFMEEGRIAVIKSEHELTKDADRQPLKEKARSDFLNALPFFEKADKLATEQAKTLQAAQKANPSAVKDEVLYTAYGKFLAGKILIQLTKSDIAKTYPKNSREFKDGLNAVAAEFSKLAAKYSDYSAGFEAKLYAAKTYKELGDFEAARGLLGELNTLSGNDYMKILSESLLLALEMNLLDKKPENYKDSIQRATAWNDNVPASAKVLQDGQKIFLLGAKNFIAYADTVKSNKTEYDKAMRNAGIFLRQIRPAYPPLAKEAAELLRKIGAVKVDKDNPKNYAEANEFAEEDWRVFAMTYAEYQGTADTAKKDEVKKQLDKIADACVLSFNRAVQMKEAGTPPAEINSIRKNLITVLWYQNKLFDAATLADDLTQNDSNSPDADKTALTAVRLYRQIFVREKLAGRDTSAAAEKLQELCGFILQRLEGQEVTGEVQLLQIETAIDNGNIDEAKALLSKTAEGTAQRISAELKIGQSLWNRYAVLSGQPEDSEEKQAKEELAKLLAEAKTQLETGLNGKVKLIKEGKDQPDSVSVQCALALAQMELNGGDAKKTIDWLFNAETGPLTLIGKPAASVPADLVKNLQLPAVMFLLRAHVATEDMSKAEETMDKLEAVIKEQNADEQKLTQIYVSLGRQLENRLKELSEANETEQAEKTANGFELFLKRIKERGEKNSFQVLYWVADTFYRLGSGISADRNVPSKAAEYYKEASETYIGILKRIVAEPDWSPPKAEETIKIRLAESLRCIGKYEAAMKFLSVMLEDGENRLDIQIEAAKTLQAWGKEDSPKLFSAVAGHFPVPQVWGWNGLIKRTSVNIDKFSEMYYESYLNKFRCTLEIAKTEKNADKKKKLLDNAYRDFASLVSMRPQLGGQDWYGQFDQTLRQIEKAQGNAKTGGIKELLKKLGETGLPPKETEVAAKKEPVKKTEAKKETKPSGTNTALFFSIGVVIVLIPVCILMLRKKKTVENKEQELVNTEHSPASAVLKPPKIKPFIFLFAVTTFFVSAVFADKITVQEGKGKSITGTILLVNAEKIVADVNGQKQEIPANVVLSVVYDKEPPLLNTARSALQDSKMSETLETLAKIDPKTLATPEMKQEYEYFRAAAKARTVLTGLAESGSLTAADAEQSVDEFLKNNKNSYHYYEVCELYGDLTVQLGKFEAAKMSYSELTKAPWAEYRLKAKTALGVTEVSERKIDAAKKNFEEVIADKDESEQTAKLKKLSNVGLARCLAAEEKYDEAVKKLEDIAAGSGSEDSAFQAALYNALGSVYAQAGKKKEAILAYLYTDILFSAARNEHIKALTELEKLWKEVKRTDRSDAIAQRLKNLYNVGK
ncbi:MAG: tetratricopeptide repeat protein [Planctomycetaceae bacterium]|jgi:hypothetical protein|nr:tetratricopeptide repeat protein [Planctomycetaceae bacterium]